MAVVAESECPVCPVMPIGDVAVACGRPTWFVRRLLDRGIRDVTIGRFGLARVIDRRDLPKIIAAVKAADEAKGRRGVPAG